MNTRSGFTFRTFLEYLGRGATPVDGYNWVEAQRAPGIEKKTEAVEDKNDAYWARVAADTALPQPRRFSYPCHNC